MEKIELKNVKCRHNITVNTNYHGNTVHVIIFFDPRDHETYYWKCTSGGLNWEEGVTYSILAQYHGNQQLSHVKLISYDRSVKGESEQPDCKINALDILFPDTHLTNDEKYDMIGLRKGV